MRFLGVRGGLYGLVDDGLDAVLEAQALRLLELGEQVPRDLAAPPREADLLERREALAAARRELEEPLPAGEGRRQDRGAADLRAGRSPALVVDHRDLLARYEAASPSAIGREAGPPLLEPGVARAAPAEGLERAVAEDLAIFFSSAAAVRASSSSGHIRAAVAGELARR
jgi:hypothetical protein